ncbi:MAG: hypothetical protein WBV62_00715, partial [Roseobacter sp.]
MAIAALQINGRSGLIVLKNSTQQNLVQNIGTLSLQIGLHETMFAKAGYRGKGSLNLTVPARTPSFSTKSALSGPW